MVVRGFHTLEQQVKWRNAYKTSDFAFDVCNQHRWWRLTLRVQPTLLPSVAKRLTRAVGPPLASAYDWVSSSTNRT